MVGGIHAFLLIYIRQEAGGKKQTAGVELVVVPVSYTHLVGISILKK